jgi:outer membrane protein OmpA-like peptidoglycan-associated protein
MDLRTRRSSVVACLSGLFVALVTVPSQARRPETKRITFTVFFQANASDLDSASVQTLKNVELEMKNNRRSGSIRLTGYIDSAEGEDVARDRVFIVWEKLIELGVPASRLLIGSRGAAFKPENCRDDISTCNRRVEIVLPW